MMRSLFALLGEVFKPARTKRARGRGVRGHWSEEA